MTLISFYQYEEHIIMEDKIILRKNPSREACESMIKRILMTEVLQNGANLHFKNATDFLPYFESLYHKVHPLYPQTKSAIQPQLSSVCLIQKDSSYLYNLSCV